ncbi:MAG: NAD-dependent epimerase/dehydratase family protein [Patescibacteria group bacterium]
MHKLAKFIYDDVEKVVNKIDFSKLNKKTVMITGATGLLGTYMVASLKRASDEKKFSVKIVALGRNKPEEYWKDLLPKGSKFIEGDITDYKFLENLPQTDYIIHAAGYGQPGKFLIDPIKTLKLNTFSTFIIFEKLRKGGKFLFISTSEIYSGSTSLPYKENSIGITNTTHKRACYIEGKRTGEAISMAYRSKGVDVFVARVSLIYGPGIKKGDQRVLNSFIEKGLKGEISLLDSGEAKRTYCYVNDGIEMLWNILLEGHDSVYNVGGESKVTIAELAQKIGKYLAVPVKIPQNDHSVSGAPEDVWLDLTKIKKEFKKTNFVSLDEGLSKTIEWVKQQI